MTERLIALRAGSGAQANCQPADPLDRVQKRWAFLLSDDVADNVPKKPDVITQPIDGCTAK